MISSQHASHGSVRTPPGFSVNPFAGQSIFGHRTCMLSGRGNQLVKLAYGCPEATEPVRVSHRKVWPTFALKAQEAVRTAFWIHLSQLPLNVLQQLNFTGKVALPIDSGGPYSLPDIITDSATEELLFRGKIQHSITDLLNTAGVNPSRAKNVSHAITALSFAFAHGFIDDNFLLAPFINRIAPGYFLCKICEEHGLPCAIGAHIIANLIILKVLPMIIDEDPLNSAAGLTLLGAYLLLGSGLVKITSSEVISDATLD